MDNKILVPIMYGSRNEWNIKQNESRKEESRQYWRIFEAKEVAVKKEK